MIKVWAWLVGNGLILLLIAGGALAVLFSVRSCRDNNQSAQAAVMAERLRGDSLERAILKTSLDDTQRQLDVALANGTRIVTRWRETAPQPIPEGSPHDSIAHLTQQVRSCREAGDSLVSSVVQIQSTCEAFKDTATKAIANWERSYSRLDSLFRIGNPPKRWGVGIYAGYGVHSDSTWAVRRGWSVGVGVTYSVIRW